MDFGLFGGPGAITPEMMQRMREHMERQQQHPGLPGFNLFNPTANATNDGNGQPPADVGDASNGAEGSGGAGDQQGEIPTVNNTHHNGVVCDVCNTEIRGFRYKCMQCADYDLCGKCEQKGNHAGHIMMRIAFPEQAQSAIRRFMNPSPPPSPRHHGHGPFGGHHGHGPHGFAGHHHVFEEMRRGGCRRRSGRVSDQSGSEDERPSGGPGCPYKKGTKEFKRWSKYIKKAAAHHHRSAAAYARAAAAGHGTAAGSATQGGTQNPQEANPMDFTAVASQIQEFLNYWGIPVDVVELYGQYCPQGQPAAGNTSANNTTGTQGAGEATNAPTSTTANAGEAAAPTGNQAGQQPTTPAAATANLSANMEQMRISEQTAAPAAGPQNESLLMDLETENSGWTLLNDARENTPEKVASQATAVPTVPQPAAPVAPVVEPNANQTVPSGPASSTTGSVHSENGSPSFASATSAGQPTQPTAPPAFPTGVPVPNVPLYPIINPAQFQQMFQGVSSALSSVVRSLPTVADPRGPLGTNVTPATPGSGVPSAGTPPASGPESQGEIDANCTTTLNQLLAMGFSNDGGYLTRLVVAKKGNLDDVLGSLFPN